MRQLTKAELLAQMKSTKNLQRHSRSLPFATVCTVCNYGLWKDFNLTIDELEKYNQEFAKIYKKADASFVEVSASYLNEKYGIDITVVLYEERDWGRYKGRKFLMEQKRDQMIAANEMFLTQQKYLVIHLLTLESMGYEKSFLIKNKEIVSRYMTAVDVKEPEEMRMEMKEQIGLIIEK